MTKERQVVDIVQLQDLSAVKLRIAAPALEVIPVIYTTQEGSITAVINGVRPGISCLKGEPVPHSFAVVRLQRVIARGRCILNPLHYRISTQGDKEGRRAPRVDQNILDVTIARRVASWCPRQGRRVLEAGL